MNLLLLLVVAIAVAAAVLAWRAGFARGRSAIDQPPFDETPIPTPSKHPEPAFALSQLEELTAERRRLFGELADSRAECARYRQIVIDLERDAPPPLLDAPNAPDDLKLIVGVGPVLERMLQQLGVFTYRQIAHWSERDIDAFDAKLPEFPGRIRRDAWVTQARALQQSKYGGRP